MAEIVDQTVSLEEGEEFGSIDDLDVAPSPEAQVEEETTEEVVEEPVSKVPAKFKDKSMEDVIQSYVELEKEYGRRSNEVGELRKLTDEIIRSSLQVNKQDAPQSSKIEVDDLLENPDLAIENAVNNSPRLKQLEEQLASAKRDEAKKVFETKHPNAYDLVQDPSFQQWVAASPVRQQMFMNAHQNYDYAVGSELIELYEQVHKVGADTAKESIKATRDKALKDAVTEKGSSGQGPKKIFKQLDIIKLMRTNPKKYYSDDFQAALVKAYQEGRVRR
jgi:hypothetical protein